MIFKFCDTKGNILPYYNTIMENVKFENDYLGREERNYTFQEWNEIDKKFISLAKKKGFFKSGIDQFDSNSVDRFVSKLTKSEDLIFDFVTYWGGGEVEI